MNMPDQPVADEPLSSTAALALELQEARQQIGTLEAQVTRYKKAVTAADESMQRYQYLFEQAGDSIFIVDPLTLKILQANSNASRRLGYPPDDLLRLTLTDLEQHSATGLPLSIWESTFSSTRVYESLYRHRDGSTLPVEVSSRLITVGDQVLMQNFVRDIRQRKAVEAEREHLIAELDAFAGTVAHDLKNPASTIITAAQTLISDGQSFTPTRTRQYLEIIDRSAYKVTQIIDSLLMLASVRKQADIPIEPLDMAAIVGEALYELTLLIRTHKAAITVAPNLPGALGYAPWVGQIWTNYLSNAIKYGGKPPVITVGGEVNGKLARFWVADNGLGIPAEMLPRLFNEFTRLDRQHTNGTGLGLSIVQRIVNRGRRSECREQAWSKCIQFYAATGRGIRQ